MNFVLTQPGISTIVESAGTADAGKIALLGDNGKFNESVIPSIVSSGIPAGALQAFAMRTVPTGWLACDGSTVSRTKYADLFAAIGATYGEGDGSTTFALPNLSDKFALGLGKTYATIGAISGEATHTLTIAEMPAHKHKLLATTGATDTQVNSTNCTGLAGWSNGSQGYTDGGGSALMENTGSSNVHNNMPPYIVVNYCIKY